MDLYYILFGFTVFVGILVVSFKVGLRKEGYSITFREKILLKKYLFILSIKGLVLVFFNIEYLVGYYGYR